MNSNSFFSKRFWQNFFISPLEFKVFVAFSFIVTLSSLIIEIFGSKQLHESIIPITGWQMFMPYAVTFMIVIFQLSKSKRLNNWTRSGYYNIGFLGFYILLMNIETLTNDGNDYNNPYLVISHWRPLWITVFPTFWILILLSPRIKKYYEFLNRDSATTL